MKKEELVTGEYYVGSWYSNKVIFRFNESLDNKTYIIGITGEFKESNGCCTGDGISFRLASPEEKEKLKKNIKEEVTIEQLYPIY